MSQPSAGEDESVWHVRKFGGSRSPQAKDKDKDKAIVAHKLAVINWHVLATGRPFHDLGTDYLDHRTDPARETRRLVARLEASATTSSSNPPPRTQFRADPAHAGWLRPATHLRFMYQLGSGTGKRSGRQNPEALRSPQYGE